MKIEPKLIHVKFLKRYKRFFADVVLNKKKITSHCPNSGSMLGLLDENNDAWISKSDNPNRKLKYTLEIINDKKSNVGVNTHRANRIVEEALENKKIKELKKFFTPEEYNTLKTVIREATSQLDKVHNLIEAHLNARKMDG